MYHFLDKVLVFTSERFDLLLTDGLLYYLLTPISVKLTFLTMAMDHGDGGY